jgi:hypothetical protein
MVSSMNIRVELLLVAAAIIAGCAVSPSPGVTGACQAATLSEQRILEIVSADIERKGRRFDPRAGKYAITRDGCDYLFAFRAVPERPGAHWTYVIDQFGKVVEFLPGT